MATGTVKWFNDAKGFGFVTQDGGGEDIFLHHTAIQSEGFRTLEEGQKVEFEVSRGPKGLQASNVHIVGGAEPQSADELAIHGIVQPEPQVWRDYWTTTDALGRDVYVDALASFISHPHTRPPLAIGLTAPWGTGKTSTMRMLQEVLDPTDKTGDRRRIEPPAWASATDGSVGATKATMRHLLRLLRSATPYGPHNMEASQSMPENWRATVWFNPWVYETSEQVLAGLAHEVTTQLTDRMGPRARELFWLRLNLSRLDGQVVRQRIYFVLLQRLIPLLLLVVGLTVVVLSLLLTGFISVAGVVVSAGGLGLLADATRRTYAFMNEQVSRSFSSLVREPDYVAQLSGTDLLPAQAASLLPDPGYNSKLGFAHIVHTDMAAVMRLVATPDHPLILFIDDLDRCSTKSVTQVIEAINMFLAGEFPDCIFILAVDPSVVAAQVGSSYKELVAELQRSRSANSAELIGWRFLEKIIQLPVRLPEVTLSQRSQFVASLRTNDTAKGAATTPISEPPDVPTETKIEEKPADDETRLLLISAMQRRHPTADTLRQVAREAQMEVLGLPEDADLDPRVLRAAQAVLVQATGNEDAQFRLLLEAGIKRLRSGGNPRQIKRLGNVFRLYAVIAAQRSLRSLPAPSLEEAAKIASLAVQWPHLLDRLFQTVGKKEQTLLQSLEEATALTFQEVEWHEALQRVGLKDDDYSGLPIEDLYDFLISDDVRIASAAQGII